MKICTVFFLLLCIFTASAQSNSGTETKQVDTSTVYTLTRKPPIFPHKKNQDEGDALRNFLYKNISVKRPKEEKNTSGRVILQLIIDIDGSIKDVKVVRSLSPLTDAEAIRVAKLLKFEPAEQDGKLVRCYYHLPIVF